MGVAGGPRYKLAMRGNQQCGMRRPGIGRVDELRELGVDAMWRQKHQEWSQRGIQCLSPEEDGWWNVELNS